MIELCDSAEQLARYQWGSRELHVCLRTCSNAGEARLNPLTKVPGIMVDCTPQVNIQTGLLLCMLKSCTKSGIVDITLLFAYILSQ